jgi:Flp pilus assembly protein TadD
MGVRSLHRATVWRNNDVFFARLIEDAPDSFRSHWATGHFAFERGDSVVGERELQTAVRLNPEHPQLLEDFGLLYAATGHYEPAIPLLSHAVEIDSTRLSSALPLALALARTRRSVDALMVLDKMSILHGETRGITLVRGEVLVRAGDFETAVDVLVGLIEREPHVWSIRQMAAEAALLAGLCNVALAQVDTALTLAPEAEKALVEAFRSTVANGNIHCK